MSMSRIVMRDVRVALSGALLVLAGGCGGGGATSNPDGGVDGTAIDTGAPIDAAAETGPPFVPPPPVESTIGPAGGTVTLTGIADVTFPAGAFAGDQLVRVEATVDVAVDTLFTESTSVFQLTGRAPYAVVVTIGDAVPTGDVTMRLTVPAALLPAAEIDAFGDFVTGGDQELLEQFHPFEPEARDALSITVSYPGFRFLPLRPADGPRKAVVVLGKRPIALPVATDTLALDEPTLQAGGCPPEPLSSPLDNLVQGSVFNPDRNITLDSGRVLHTHFGTDFRAAEGTPVYAVGDGIVAGSFFSDTGGEMIIIALARNNGAVSYLHLMSRAVKRGDRVCRGQQIGLSGNTGTNTTGAHLHFELVPVGGTRIDPWPCIDSTLPRPRMCPRWSGMIHVVDEYMEMTRVENGNTTVARDNHWRAEHTWQLGENHIGQDPMMPNGDLIDLSWNGRFNATDSEITTYATPTCERGFSSDETFTSGSGNKTSHLSITQSTGTRILSLRPEGAIIQIPKEQTKTNCGGYETKVPGNYPLTEFAFLGLVQDLTLLKPSPSDPDLFVGSGVVILDMELPVAGGTQKIKSVADWRINRNF